MGKELLIEVKDMCKNFGPTKALKHVDMKFYRGEIRGLVGENGSGKSTVTSIIAGMQKATSGEMFYKGKPWNPESMVDAQRHGISMVLQEANTIPGCTVAENLFAGRFDECSKFGFVNMREVNTKAQKMLDSFGIEKIRATDPIDRLTFEDRKLMEIVRCVTDETEVFVVDETTTALSLEGRKILYDLIHRLKDAGKSVIFISHDMDEILEQCSSLTVLRDGSIIGTIEHDELCSAQNDSDKEKLIEKIRFMMVGREIGNAYYRSDYDVSHSDEVALEFDNVSVGPVKNFSLKLHKGEILGFGGLSDCGMRLIGRAGFGLEKLSAGKVVRNGRVINNSITAIKSGIGYISKNRDTEALILSADIAENIALPSYSQISKFTFINPFTKAKMVNREVKNYSIKCKSPKQAANTLSGGNKQKVSFAKWTAKDSDVIIMDCPTRGVDIGVKQAMYGIIADMKKKGKAIILISEELSELIGMADKIIVMKDYKISSEFMRSPDLKETDIIGTMI